MKKANLRFPVIILLLFTSIILTGCRAKEVFNHISYDNYPYNEGIAMNTDQSKSISDSNLISDRKSSIYTTNNLTAHNQVSGNSETGVSSKNYSSFLKTSTFISDNSFVSKLKVASKIDQLVCVVGNGSYHPTVSYFIKDSEGIWHQQFKITGDCGYKGITYHKKEGDKKTPAGLYPFTIAFGIKSNPGTILSYRHVTKYDYWVDDTKSPYYNTWVNSKETPGKYKSEHLIEKISSYNYALNIDYNPDRIPGIGSAIFLHCTTKSGRTAGCIAIPEKYMKKLLQNINESAMILIVPSEKYLTKY